MLIVVFLLEINEVLYERRTNVSVVDFCVSIIKKSSYKAAGAVE